MSKDSRCSSKPNDGRKKVKKSEDISEMPEQDE